MWKVLSKRRLEGAPREPRVKTYRSQSGYVFEYRFQGRRERMRGVDYLFQVSPDRRTETSVSVTISRKASRAWSDAHRPLRDNEQYGIAKMALFRAFDACENPAALQERIHPSQETIEEICNTLDLP